MKAVEAKEISLKVWTYLRDHPDIQWKEHLPEELYSLIKNMSCYCPLCEYFAYGSGGSCTKCPLRTVLDTNCGCQDIINNKGLFHKWAYAFSDKGRALSASRIVARIEKWDAEKLDSKI